MARQNTNNISSLQTKLTARATRHAQPAKSSDLLHSPRVSGTPKKYHLVVVPGKPPRGSTVVDASVSIFIASSMGAAGDSTAIDAKVSISMASSLGRSGVSTGIDAIDASVSTSIASTMGRAGAMEPRLSAVRLLLRVLVSRALCAERLNDVGLYGRLFLRLSLRLSLFLQNVVTRALTAAGVKLNVLQLLLLRGIDLRRLRGGVVGTSTRSEAVGSRSVGKGSVTDCVVVFTSP